LEPGGDADERIMFRRDVDITPEDKTESDIVTCWATRPKSGQALSRLAETSTRLRTLPLVDDMSTTTNDSLYAVAGNNWKMGSGGTEPLII
jgi:hypothetical protein